LPVEPKHLIEVILPQRRNHARFSPDLTLEGTFQTLSNYSQKFTHNLTHSEIAPNESLFGLINLIRTIPFGGLSSKEPQVSVFALSTTVLEAIRNLPQDFPLIQRGTTLLNANNGFAINASIDAEGVHPDYYVNARTSEEKRTAMTLNMIWTICENGIYQGDFIYKVANQLVLSGLVGFKNLPANPTRTEELFQRRLGISAYDYMMSLFALWTMAHNFGSVNVTSFIRSGPRKNELDQATQQVLNELSLRFNEFIPRSNTEPYINYTGKSKSLSLFTRWPMINLNDELYLFAGHPFVKIQSTSKFLTKALALARIEERIPDTQFSQFVGLERFEPFFRELCEIWAPEGGHYDEYVYLRRGNSKSADRIAFEKHGTSKIVHLFQLKLKSLKEASHYGVTIDDVVSDLSGAFSRLISQTIKFLYALNQAKIAGNLAPEHEELSLRILAADKYSLIGIVPDLPSIFIFKQLRDKIIEGSEALLNQQEKVWYDQSLKRKFLWHIFDLSEFEIFISLPRTKRDFYKVLSKYLRDSRVDEYLIDNIGRLPYDFRSYMISKFGEAKLEDGSRRIDTIQPDLLDIYENLQNDIGRYFFGTNNG
jgi:hypothetical protein